MSALQVIEHRPGPSWIPGTSFREQPGVEHHLATMRGWLASGVLVIGGPFLDDAGGGMAVVAFADLVSAEQAALADRAVAEGLLTAHVRPWLVGMAGVDTDRFDPER